MSTAEIDSHMREVTEDEIRAYREQGWALLPSLLSPQLAGEMLSRLKDLSGLHYDELPRSHPDAQSVMEKLCDKSLFRIFSMARLRDERVGEISSSRVLGEASARLTGHRPMRLFCDSIYCKLPAWTEEGLGLRGRASVWSGETPWHQDFGPVPWDRSDGVQFWLALTEITPEMGSMQHLTGSHREAPLGAQHLGGQSLRETNPELWDKYELSPPHHFQPGDVLAHDALTVHFAQSNQTDGLRWVYMSYRIPADTLNNGIPFPRFKEFGLSFELWKPFDHPVFPIVSD